MQIYKGIVINSEKYIHNSSTIYSHILKNMRIDSMGSTRPRGP